MGAPGSWLGQSLRESPVSSHRSLIHALGGEFLSNMVGELQRWPGSLGTGIALVRIQAPAPPACSSCHSQKQRNGHHKRGPGSPFGEAGDLRVAACGSWDWFAPFQAADRFWCNSRVEFTSRVAGSSGRRPHHTRPVRLGRWCCCPSCGSIAHLAWGSPPQGAHGGELLLLGGSRALATCTL